MRSLPVNLVTIKLNEIIATTRFNDPSANLKMANVLLVLNGSAMGRSGGWNRRAAPAVLALAAAGISRLLGWLINGLSMVKEVD